MGAHLNSLAVSEVKGERELVGGNKREMRENWACHVAAVELGREKGSDRWGLGLL